MRKVNVPVMGHLLFIMTIECSRNVHSIVGNKVKNREENPLLANELAFSSGKQGGFMIKEDGLPVGLGFGLAMNEKALGQFSMMTEDEKRQVIDAARGAQTKEQMAQIVKDIADMEFLELEIMMGNNMDLNYEMFCYQCEQTANGKDAPNSVSAERRRRSLICRIF